MVSVSAEQNSLRLKLTHPKLFTDVCYSHASRLLGIRDRRRIVDLIGDIQGTIVDPLASHTSAATTKKLFKGMNFCICHSSFKSPMLTFEVIYLYICFYMS